MGITSDSFSRESFERNLDAAREVVMGPAECIATNELPGAWSFT